jgi:hypothetical protein
MVGTLRFAHPTAGSTAPHLRRYRRKARDRILRILEILAFEEGRIDHGQNGRHDRKSYYAPHAAYLVQLNPLPAGRGPAGSIPGIRKLFGGFAMCRNSYSSLERIKNTLASL